MLVGIKFIAITDKLNDDIDLATQSVNSVWGCVLGLMHMKKMLQVYR